MIQNDRSSSALALGLCFSMTLATACSSESNDAPAGPLRILVTNDDGVGAPGIDAVVQAVIQDPNNEVIVSAPAEQRSGSADNTIETRPSCGTGAASESATMSGYDENVWAVDGCPADSVLYALDNLYPDALPHVVLSGINEGQNVGFVNGGALSQVSGTVGAAKTGACRGVPALASSQGEGEEIDYESGVVEVLRWLEANRANLLAGNVSLDNITSINIPTCDTGSIRGRVEVPLGTEIPDYINTLVDPQDCESTLENPQDDLEAFFNGFVSVSPVPSNSNETCDKLAN
ncbi:MAG: 5'/3'-nucleotidase SurE [Polyangiales bacterium]